MLNLEKNKLIRSLEDSSSEPPSGSKLSPVKKLTTSSIFVKRYLLKCEKYLYKSQKVFVRVTFHISLLEFWNTAHHNLPMKSCPKADNLKCLFCRICFFIWKVLVRIYKYIIYMYTFHISSFNFLITTPQCESKWSPVQKLTGSNGCDNRQIRPRTGIT